MSGNMRMAELVDQVAILERALFREIRAHDKTIQELEARKRELERIRSNNYSERVKQCLTEDRGDI